LLQDVCGQQRILKDRIVPRSPIYSCRHFCFHMIGVEAPRAFQLHEVETTAGPAQPPSADEPPQRQQRSNDPA
jgi:uncharacterized circularly permuted ATP-grasp superfamily protein